MLLSALMGRGDLSFWFGCLRMVVVVCRLCAGAFSVLASDST